MYSFSLFSLSEGSIKDHEREMSIKASPDAFQGIEKYTFRYFRPAEHSTFRTPWRTF
jgi:hypothetical protein